MVRLICRVGLLTARVPTSVWLTLAPAIAVPATKAAQIVLAAHKIEIRVITFSFEWRTSTSDGAENTLRMPTS